jgi:PAS domain S-box-containing protein
MNNKEMSDIVEDCNQIIIHKSGKIQQYSTIIVIDEDNFEIVNVALNISDFFDIYPKDIMNKELYKIFELDNEKFQEALKKIKTDNYTAIDMRYRGVDFVARLINGSESVIIEIEKDNLFQSSVEDMNFLRDVTTAIQKSNEFNELFDVLLVALRDYIGFDRLMIYTFDRDFNGEVIAELKKDYMNSFLGHSFPADDIPLNARELYKKNIVRLIEDVDYTPVELYNNDSILDMSFVNGRSVAPIHIEYLNNMSVKASMSISIVVGGELWGLVACHNNTPHYTSMQKRVFCEEFSRIVSVTIENRDIALKTYQDSLRVGALAKLITFSTNSFSSIDISKQKEIFLLLTTLISAGGIAICDKDNIVIMGNTPSIDQIKEISQLIKPNLGDPIVTVDSLATLSSKFERFHKKASGVFVLFISREEKIVWFRPDNIKNIAWAGQPIKHFYNDNGTLKISPRKSFETFCESKYCKSEPWSSEDKFFAKEFYQSIQSNRHHTWKSEQVESLLIHHPIFSQIFGIMPQAVIITDLDSTIIYINDAFSQMSGYGSGDVIGRSISILKSGVHDRSFYGDIWTNILSLRVWNGKITNKRANGELYTVDVTISPIINNHSDIMAFISIQYEITPLIDKIEEQQIQINDNNVENREVDIITLMNIKYKAKKEILSQIAHHWRQPLMRLGLLLQDVFYAYDDGELTQEYLENFNNNTKDLLQSMSITIDNFANFFKPEDTKRFFKISEHLKNCLKAIAPDLELKKIALELNIEESNEIDSYPAALTRVMLELINNIEDIVVARNILSAEVSILGYRVDDNYLIQITDNCGGIENIESIFEPYYSTKGVQSGVGLGLFTVKTLIEKYFFGTIYAENKYLGAHFTINIPSNTRSLE